MAQFCKIVGKSSRNESWGMMKNDIQIKDKYFILRDVIKLFISKDWNYIISISKYMSWASAVKVVLFNQLLEFQATI